MVSFMLLPPRLVAAPDWDRLHIEFLRMGGKPQTFLSWQKLLKDNRELPVADKLRLVNDFFNRNIRFSSDEEAWGQTDYWATPMESLARAVGDCEDYVIAKYFALLHLDIPSEKLRLIYVKAMTAEPSGNVVQAHMVLAYYPAPDAEPLLMDNLVAGILPASRRNDLLPVYSFNNQGIFTGVAATAALGRGGVGRLTRWQDLLQRAHNDGSD